MAILPFAKKMGFGDDKSATNYGSPHIYVEVQRKEQVPRCAKKNVHCIICEITQLKGSV